MRKILITTLLFIFIIAFASYIYAFSPADPLPDTIDNNETSQTDNNFDNNNANNMDNQNIINNNDFDDTDNITNITPPQAEPATTTAAPMDFFTAENILSIILITIGVVLILLGIAIFIRLK